MHLARFCASREELWNEVDGTTGRVMHLPEGVFIQLLKIDGASWFPNCFDGVPRCNRYEQGKLLRKCYESILNVASQDVSIVDVFF